jgi:hypothetical protein
MRVRMASLEGLAEWNADQASSIAFFSSSAAALSPS